MSELEATPGPWAKDKTASFKRTILEYNTTPEQLGVTLIEYVPASNAHAVIDAARKLIDCGCQSKCWQELAEAVKVYDNHATGDVK